MINHLKWIFFDLGGVVVDLRPSFARLSSVIDRPRADVEQIYARHAALAACGLITTAEFWRRIEQDLHVTPPSAITDYAEFWTDNLIPITETHAFLREIPPIYKLGVLSNTEQGVYESALRKGRIPDIPFAVVIKSCDFGVAKPDRRIYEIAQEKAGASPSEILFIDDRPENIESALALGWQGVLFDSTHPEQSIREIRAKLAG